MLDNELSVELDGPIVDQLQSVDLEQRELDAMVPLALGIEFYRKHWISLGQASMVSEVDLSQFVHELGVRGVPVIGLGGEEMSRELNRVRKMIGEGGRS